MKNILLALCALLLLHCSAMAQLNLQWQDLGPDNLGGSIRGLIIDNRDTTRQTLYAGVMGGGIWKTTDGGNWWNFLGCAGNYAVSCITQAKDGSIYIGTGGLYPEGTNIDEDHLGNGIYKLDSADNIIHLDSTSSQGYGSTWSSVSRIAVNPVNVSEMIAANASGLYKSNNAGHSWQNIAIPGYTSFYAGSYDVKWSNDGLKIFADIGDIYFPNVLVRSIDGGNTWAVVDSSNPGFPKIPPGRIEVAISPSNSDIIYLSIASGGGALYGIYKSVNAGNTWDSLVGNVGLYPLGNQGQYDNSLAVSPADSDKIYFGGIAMFTYSTPTGTHRLPDFVYPNAIAGNDMQQFLYVINDRNPDEVYVATNKGVFKSTDGFSNFTSAQFYDHNYHLNARDFISMAAAPNGQVMGGSRDAQGLLIGNISNQHFINLNTGYGYCDFSQLDTSYAFMEAAYGQLYESKDMLNSFFSAYDTSIDPQLYGVPTRCSQFFYENTNFYAALLLNETKTAFETNDSVIYTATSDLTEGSPVTVTSATANTQFIYSIPQQMSRGDSIVVPDPVKSRLFLATNCGIWMKRHAVTLINPDWYHISGYTTYNANCFAVTKNGNKVYAVNDSILSIEGLNFGHYTTYDMTDSFITRSYKLPSGNAQAVAVDPNNDSTLLVAAGGYNLANRPNIFKSVDAGRTWRSIQVGPEGMSVYTCIIDANNSNNYIIGTEHGIWTSSDSGASWQQNNANMCDVPVFQLRQLPLLSGDCYVLYAATNSHGLWRSYSLTPAGCYTSVGVQDNESNKENEFSLYPNPANSYTTIEFSLATPQPVTIQIHDITGRLIQNLQQFLAGYNQKIELNTSLLHPGDYLVSVKTDRGIQTKLLVIQE